MTRSTRLSTKGQVIIPKEIRDRQGWTSGTQLTVRELDGGVELRALPGPDQPSLRDLAGCLHTDGPPKTLADMEEGIRRGAAKSR
ncbi:MAG: AbrB/MazE/SpoVT family DNA-binding domain-containing protein [Acidobacteriota bacterium]